MTLPNSPRAYDDCYEAMDRALADSVGIRIPVKSQTAATHLRARLHQARNINRRENKLAYEEGHAMYGASVYDKLAVSIRQTKSGLYVYVVQINLKPEDTEALSEIEDEPALVPEPGQALERALEALSIRRRA